MTRDMRKIPLGTYQTPIGHHPECPENTDQAPDWLVWAYLVLSLVVIVFFVIDYFYVAVVSNFYLEMFLFSFGAYSLLHAMYNWKKKITRYSDLILFAFYVGTGLYIATGFGAIFKP